MLKVNGIDVYYGKVQVLWDVSLEVKEGEIVALVGANGAGKTTLLNTISGVILPRKGSVEFAGSRIDGLPLHRIVEMGISHIPEGAQVFDEMSVRDNLDMGAYIPDCWKKRKERLQTVYSIFPKLKEREKQLASTLSGGERQILAIGRGLMSNPKLCMFDEPSFGLAPKLVIELFNTIESLKEHGITVLLVEQNVRHALEMADRAYVIENGRIVLEGKARDVLQNDYVKKAYLGL
jgi:branched-chain amino acid transport system ATP-binding protein